MLDIEKKCHGQSGEDEAGRSFKREKTIEIRVSFTELARLRELAYQGGFNSLAQYVREAAIAGKSAQSPSKRQEALRRCSFELSKIGTNCNQIAHKANSGSPIDQEMLMMLEQVKDIAQGLYENATKVLK